MKYIILVMFSLLVSSFLSAKENSQLSEFETPFHQLTKVQFLINYKADNKSNTKSLYKTDCEAVYLAQSALNQIAYDINRSSCISTYGNTTAGINCQTYALQAYSATEIGNYNEFMNCMYPYTLP